MNIYVGNLSFQTTETELRDAFAVHGTVDSARLVTDKFTGAVAARLTPSLAR